MKEYKRLTLILSIFVGVIVTLVVLLFTLFGLNKVEMCFQNNSKVFADETIVKQIISSANFKKHSCVLFLNKDKYINKLEKENSYLKIINIETKFPNNLVIHCAEREEIFAIKNGDRKYFICDVDFKVLKILDYSNTELSDEYLSTQNNAIILNGINVLNSSAVVGDFLTILESKEIVYNFVTSMAVNNRDIAETKALIKELTLSYNVLGQAKLLLKLHSEYSVEILDTSNFLSKKINLFLSIYDKIPATDYSTHKLIIIYNQSENTFNGHHTKII